VHNVLKYMKVVVHVLDAPPKPGVAAQLAQIHRIEDIQRRIKQVEYKALVNQMEARLAHMRLQQIELQQLIQYTHKLMDIQKRERELITLTNSLHARIDVLKEQLKQAKNGAANTGAAAT